MIYEADYLLLPVLFPEYENDDDVDYDYDHQHYCNGNDSDEDQTNHDDHTFCNDYDHNDGGQKMVVLQANHQHFSVLLTKRCRHRQCKKY